MYQFDATHPSFLFLETMKMKIWKEHQSPPLDVKIGLIQEVLKT